MDCVDKFYIGRAVENRQQGFWRMKFLHQISLAGEPIFNWPRLDDFDVVHESAVVFGPICLEGFLKDLKVLAYKHIEAAFRKSKTELK